MQRKILFTFASIFIFALAGFAKAATTQWHDLGGGKARLHAILDPDNGQIEAVLEVELNKGWSTYWRNPGGAGIPPVFDFSGSQNVKFGEASFPVPQLLGDKTLRYAGYKGRVLFPIKGLKIADGNPRVDLDLLIGVCETICIPAEAKMRLDAASLLQSSPQATRAVTFSRLSLPQEKSSETILQYEKLSGQKLLLTLKTGSVDRQPALFVEGPADWYLAPAKLLKQEGELATFEIDVSRAPKDTDILGTKLRYTLSLGNSGIEFTR